jgi:hypothetical protein
MAMSLLLPLFRSGHAVRTDRMQRAFPGIRFFYIHLYFTGFYSKMQGCVQHFCHFPVFSANVLIPGCINAIQFLQYPLQTLFESKPFVVTALPVKMRLLRSAERNREI